MANVKTNAADIRTLAEIVKMLTVALPPMPTAGEDARRQALGRLDALLGTEAETA